MNDRRLYKSGLSLLMVVLLLLSGFTQRSLNQDRADLGLTRMTPLDNAPPLLAFTTVALGGFRGLIASLLWIRANELQINDKYFEMVQLSDWITKLQPHFAPVWQYMAWNMAYNISIKFPDPNDRWHWVNNGITMLRDEALRYNPNQALLYAELANILQHKIGDDIDDAHLFYKTMWAWQFQQVVGQKPDFDALIDPKTPEQQEQARQLRQIFKMDPAFMKEVDLRYGPLEWRLPETHAIYWSLIGVRNADKEQKVRLRRLVMHSMQMAVRRGRMIENLSDQRLEFGPNIDMLPNANRSYEEMMKEDPEWAASMENGHRNFLQKAVSDLYIYNRHAEASAWFDYLKLRYPDTLWANLSMDQYVIKRIEEEVESMKPSRIQNLVEGFVSQAYYALAVGEDERYLGALNMAKQIWKVQYDKVTQFGIETINERMRLPDFNYLQTLVLAQCLNPQASGFSPQLAAQLMSRLGIKEPPKLPENQKVSIPVPVPKLKPTDVKVPFENIPKATNAAPQIRTLNSSPAFRDRAKAASRRGICSRSFRLTISTGECM
jgi:hypothetical protein